MRVFPMESTLLVFGNRSCGYFIHRNPSTRHVTHQTIAESLQTPGPIPVWTHRPSSRLGVTASGTEFPVKGNCHLFT